MKFLQTSIMGDQNLGLYGFATDKYAFLGLPNKKVKKVLGVPVYSAAVMNMSFVGMFVAGNSHGIVTSSAVMEYDSSALEKFFPNILELKTKYTVVGNMVMMNDKGIIISPLLKKHRKAIEDFFGIHCNIGTIARQKIVGNLGLATNKGCLLHPKVKKDEMQLIEETLKVKADIGTVNFGSPYPGAGVLANSNGFVASDATSGPELGRITEALGFL